MPSRVFRYDLTMQRASVTTELDRAIAAFREAKRVGNNQEMASQYGTIENYLWPKVTDLSLEIWEKTWDRYYERGYQDRWKSIITEVRYLAGYCIEVH